MNNQVKTYYLPNNPNISKGHIYTMYLNNNTNLDLSSIVTMQTPPQKLEQSSIVLSKEDYIRLLELSDLAHHLTAERTINIQKFIGEETKLATELSKINLEREQMIKKLTKERKTSI